MLNICCRSSPCSKRRSTNGGPTAHVDAAPAAAAAAAAPAPHRHRRTWALLALSVLLTLALHLLMHTLLTSHEQPLDTVIPTACDALWQPLRARLASPLAALCFPGEALGRAQTWLASRWRRRVAPAATALKVLKAAEPGPPRPTWLLQQQRVGTLQQELASCSSGAHRCQQDLAARAAEAEHCQQELATVTADAIRTQEQLLSALDAQAEEAAEAEAAIAQAQAAQAAGQEVQLQLAMVESRAAQLAQHLHEQEALQRQAEAAGRQSGG